jgi:drug/metabolite transporter (DMT)-like permease
MNSVTSWWPSLPGNVRGTLWILMSAILFTAMTALIKDVGTRINTFEIAFFRSLFGVLVLLPLVARNGWRETLRPKRLDFILARGITGSVALITIVYALTHLPLADVTGISFSRSLWLIVLAIFFLGESPNWQRWVATIVGFVGVWIIVQPSMGMHPAAVAAILNALFVAMSVALIKRMTSSDSPLTILFWGMAIPMLVTAAPTILVWQTPTMSEFVLLAIIGVGLSAGHSGLIHGLRVGEATAVMPFDYTRLIFAAFAGFLFFGEIPSMNTVLGALLIAASALYIARREARNGTEEEDPV